MHYDLVDLRLMIAVMEERGIAAGARKANLSVSALSERIKELEHNVGAQLFHRGARGTAPTPAGIEFASRARAILLQVARLDQTISSWQQRHEGEVRMLINSNAIASFLPDAIAGFMARHPSITVNLREALSSEVLQAVRAGEADIGIAAIGSMPHDDLRLHRFRQDRLVLVAPTGHWLSANEKVSLLDCLDEPFVGLDDGAAIQKYLSSHAARMGRVLQPRIKLRSFESVCRMVASGVGITIVPESVVTNEMLANGISAIPMSDDWASRELCICLPGEAALNPIVDQLVKDLKEYSSTF
ncbi:LysR family transcriptional regulator [Aminobacter sp. MSH1]|uniref:LysR family transcriptional regulator n=1 Tax=Aminobacter sp. MSH1 TaxID=374606 RepID=UPI000D34976B|nr:LysR family transcriptional regulator [Aminobacter sp. MSH1]